MNLLLDTNERESKLPATYAIPDCSQPKAIEDWSYRDLHTSDLDYLVKLYAAQPESVDRLGSTSTATRMAVVFSAKTGRPTSAATLYRALMSMRLDGQLPKRR